MICAIEDTLLFPFQGFYKYEKNRVDIRERAAIIAVTQYNDLSNYTNNTAIRK